MKTAILTLAAIVLASGGALAAPGKNFDRGFYGRGHITPYERVQISRSAMKLAVLKSRAWRDGRITFLERLQINRAERQHAALVARARRT